MKKNGAVKAKNTSWRDAVNEELMDVHFKIANLQDFLEDPEKVKNLTHGEFSRLERQFMILKLLRGVLSERLSA